jgi:hypothetical protein
LGVLYAVVVVLVLAKEAVPLAAHRAAHQGVYLPINRRVGNVLGQDDPTHQLWHDLFHGPLVLLLLGFLQTKFRSERMAIAKLGGKHDWLLRLMVIWKYSVWSVYITGKERDVYVLARAIIAR